jgi:hypothetical protein
MKLATCNQTLVDEKSDHGKQLAQSIFVEHLFSCPISLKKVGTITGQVFNG